MEDTSVLLTDLPAARYLPLVKLSPASQGDRD